MGEKLERFMAHVAREFEGKPERAQTIRIAVDARRKKILELGAAPVVPPAAEVIT